MKVRLTASVLGLIGCVCSAAAGPLGLGGCASTAPPLPVPAASVTLPAPRPPTLSVQTRYEQDGLVLALRLDGEPVRGEVRVVDPAPLEPLVSPGDPISAEDAARGRALTATEGEIRFPVEEIPAWMTARELELVVAGRRYPYAQSPGAWAFGCEASVVELGKMDPCTQPLPLRELPPPHCDASGQSAWEQIRSRHAATQERCWRALDDTTFDQLPRITQPPLHAEACLRVLEGAAQASEAVGIRLVTACEPQLSAEQRGRWLLAERRATLPGAFAAARTARADEQRAFYLRYRVTKDPRVEEIRQLAARTYGPKNPARFLAAARALEALNSSERRVQLCSFDEKNVRLIYSYRESFFGDNRPADPASLPARVARAEDAEENDREGGLVGSEDEGAGLEPGRRGCGLRSPVLLYRIEMRRPDPRRAQIEHLATSLTGARQIQWSGECTATERWYLLPPPGE